MSYMIGLGEWSPFASLLAPALLIGAIAWCVLAVTLALRNGTMERPSRVAQLYGYTVCLISLVTLLFTVPSLVDNLFQLNQPLYSADRFPEFGGSPSLASFEAYKATYDRVRRQVGDTVQSAPPSDDELRNHYEALRSARVEANRFQARRELVREVLLLAFAGGLFLGHWRWLRRRSEDLSSAA